MRLRKCDPFDATTRSSIALHAPCSRRLPRFAPQAATRHPARITGRLWANALDVLTAAAIDGGGIVRTPSWHVAEHIRSGWLLRILQGYVTTPAPVNVLFERARRTSPSAQAFLDYLAEATETCDLVGMSRFAEALSAANG